MSDGTPSSQTARFLFSMGVARSARRDALHGLRYSRPRYWTAGSGAYAMVGMAAFFAATAKAPTTSILILFEMTNDYRIMLPLMAATVGSVYLSHRLSPFSIYTLKLHRWGISYPGREEAERSTQRMAASRAVGHIYWGSVMVMSPRSSMSVGNSVSPLGTLFICSR